VQAPKPPWEPFLLKLPALQLGATGWASAAMCALYMWTGMGGDGVDGSLPLNPGAVYKSEDVALKHRVWKAWGYGNQTMRV
jgi:hypothetical protein